MEKFTDYGRSFFDVLAEAMTFEKSFAPQVKKWESEFNTLNEKSERLGVELAEARAELDRVQASGYTDLRASRSASKALSLAKNIHARATEILKLELEQAKANAAKFNIAELPFQHRRQMVRKVALTLFDVGGISLKYQTADYGLDETRRWIKQVEILERSLAVLTGKVALDSPIGFSAPGPEAALGMAAVLPAKALDNLISAWLAASTEDAARIALNLGTDGRLRWKILKKTIARQLITSHDVENYDIAGEAGNGKRPQAIDGNYILKA